MDYLHRERHYTWFARDISSPEEVDPDKADGSMNTGILDLTIPEKEPRPGKRPGKIEIHFSLTRVECPRAYFWYS